MYIVGPLLGKLCHNVYHTLTYCTLQFSYLWHYHFIFHSLSLTHEWWYQEPEPDEEVENDADDRFGFLVLEQ